MRVSCLLGVLILLAGCEFYSSEAEVPDNIDKLVEHGLANRIYVGTPDEEPVLFSLTGIVTDEQGADPATARNRNSQADAVLALGDSVLSASNWPDAHRAVSAYLASPPENVAGLPAYVLEQLAAQTMASHRTKEFLDPKNVTSASVYAGFLAGNAYPDPRPVARFLAANAATLSASERKRLAAQALAASELYQTTLRDTEARLNCDACFGAPIDASWTRADEGLARVADPE